MFKQTRAASSIGVTQISLGQLELRLRLMKLRLMRPRLRLMRRKCDKTEVAGATECRVTVRSLSQPLRALASWS